MSGRTLENAMAHADVQRKRKDANDGLDCAEYDLVLLADEVLRLRKELEELKVDAGSMEAMINTEFG